jgi:phage repressor protein C with HTH and peptisase S24 domain
MRAVSVRGDSMLPTLRDGDACLVRWGAPARLGDVVVARLPPDAAGRPRPLGVKRVALREVDGACWLRSDNVGAGTDSATFGTVPAADVLGRVVLRYWPRPAWVRRVS